MTDRICATEMIDRGLTIIGLAGTILSLALPYMLPKVPKQWAYLGAGVSAVLLLMGLAMLSLPRVGRPASLSVRSSCNAVGDFNSNCSPWFNVASHIFRLAYIRTVN